jgi:hypothetical protein
VHALSRNIYIKEHTNIIKNQKQTKKVPMPKLEKKNAMHESG